MAEDGKTKAVAISKAESLKKSAIQKLASRLDISVTLLTETLKASAFNLCKTNEQFVAAVIIANTYGLNPILREMYAFPGKNGGVIPILSVDGWIKIVNRQPNFNGVELIENEDDKGELVSVTAKFYLKNTDHPVVVTEYLKECFDPSKEPWKRWPRRMLRHKAYIQGARVAFGFSGLYDEDEKDRIDSAVDAQVISDPVIELKGDKNKKAIPGQEKIADGQAELVDDPTEFMQVGDLARFGESAGKAKFIADSILTCGQKLGKEKFMAVVGSMSFEKITQVTKFEDLVALGNALLEEVKKLEQ